MNTEDINTIISKYLDGETTVAEETFLLEWIKNPHNRQLFEDFIRTETWVAYNYDASIIDKQLNDLSINAPIKRIGLRKKLLKYAAVLVVLISSAMFFYAQRIQVATDIRNKNVVSLEINNGSSNFYSLENLEEFSLKDPAIRLEERRVLHYEPIASISETHTIHVPYGKTFKVVLADGSEVQLNAGSRFTYPKSFNGLTSRSVSLVGEGYFDISKSNIPFRVNTENLTTEVLGTEFNISAYKEDAAKEVILVEGAVRVSHGLDNRLKPRTMLPNERVTVWGDREEMVVETINSDDYLGWTSGVLVFHQDNMATIFKKLERKFNIRIENNFEKLESLSFNGRFSKKETLEEVLGTMQAHTNFSFTLSDTNTLEIYEPLNLESL
ncbi:DUF4974 domain-containing protein [Maribacter sp.]|nr:DUF4974 domain-containing protein [Maribacter sp.]